MAAAQAKLWLKPSSCSAGRPVPLITLARPRLIRPCPGCSHTSPPPASLRQYATRPDWIRRHAGPSPQKSKSKSKFKALSREAAIFGLVGGTFVVAIQYVYMLLYPKESLDQMAKERIRRKNDKDGKAGSEESAEKPTQPSLWTALSGGAKSINDVTFTPYTIAAREALSPTTFVLTLAPKGDLRQSPVYLLPGTQQWKHPLWSVEFKQPYVQISRHYTPLPPTEGDDGNLRFYIRTVGDGEMSKYLGSLREGQDVELRGPHVGFDIVKRLGACKNVVFLAGGTGIAPGLQTVKAVLDGQSDTKISLLWAVRKREEIQGVPVKEAQATSSRGWSFWSNTSVKVPQPELLVDILEAPSPIIRHIAELKSKYGERLNVQFVIDEEKSFFAKPHLQKALTDIYPNDEALSTVAPSTGASCTLHDQFKHTRISSFEPESPGCSCDATKAGRNLFIVSGPDGFIEHFTGGKVWEGGHHAQGPVGGVVGDIQKAFPRLQRDWLVLKL